MQFKVIYIDGTAGIEPLEMIDELVKSCKIIAFRCTEGWIEVRRRGKADIDFDTGIDRRKTKPDQFFSTF